MVRKLIVHSKNPDGQKRQKAIATLGVIGPKDSESIMRAIAHGLADKEVTTHVGKVAGCYAGIIHWQRCRTRGESRGTYITYASIKCE